VVVVDSGSTDGTLTIVRGFGSAHRDSAGAFTYGYALNVGAVECEADMVVSLSAHSTPVGPDWLRCLLEPFANQRVAAVYGARCLGRMPLPWSC
jgi:glycosyltransferase involved in cell wall biosynthesis